MVVEFKIPNFTYVFFTFDSIFHLKTLNYFKQSKISVFNPKQLDETAKQLTSSRDIQWDITFEKHFFY